MCHYGTRPAEIVMLLVSETDSAQIEKVSPFYVVTPPAEQHVAGRGRHFDLELEREVGLLRVAGEADRVCPQLL